MGYSEEWGQRDRVSESSERRGSPSTCRGPWLVGVESPREKRRDNESNDIVDPWTLYDMLRIDDL